MKLPQSEQAQWFADEVQPHEPVLRSYLRGAFPTVRDVDDIVQESLLRVWRARLDRPVQSTKSFLFHIARHLAVDFIRRGRSSPIVVVTDLAYLPVLDERPGVAEAVCTRDELMLLSRALRSLPPRCRDVIILRKIDGLSQKQIAAQLGLSELTVQVHVVRGLRRLEAYFRSYGDGDNAETGGAAV